MVEEVKKTPSLCDGCRWGDDFGMCKLGNGSGSGCLFNHQDDFDRFGNDIPCREEDEGRDAEDGGE